MSSKAKPLTRIITVWARVKPGTPRVVMPAQSEWFALHARNRRFHTLSTSLCQRLVSSVAFVLALGSLACFQRCRPVGLASPLRAATAEAVAAEGAAARPSAVAGQGSHRRLINSPAGLIGAKARAAMALGDLFDGVIAGSEKHMFVSCLGIACFQLCSPVGLAQQPKAATAVAAAAKGAPPASTSVAGEESPIAPAPTTGPAALVGAKAKAAIALADSFDGMVLRKGSPIAPAPRGQRHMATESEMDISSAEPSEGAGEEVGSLVMRGIRDVMN